MAITAVSAVLAVIIPPSILMIVWGGVLSVSIGALFLAGVIPGLLIGLVQMATVHVYAKRRGYPTYGRSTLREFAASLLCRSRADDAGDHHRRQGLRLVHRDRVGVHRGALCGRAVDAGLPRDGLQGAVPRADRHRAARRDRAVLRRHASAFGWLLAYYQIPKAILEGVSAWGMGLYETGFFIAAVFLVVGCFLDAIPAIIIVGTILQPLAQAVGMDPVHFAMIGIVSLAFGLVTPPYGLCLMIACSVAGVRMASVLKDTMIMLLPMWAC